MPSTLSRVTSYLAALYFWGTLGLVQAEAQTIAPASDGTGTIVNAEGDLFNITGGQLSGDGANLFHSFQQFGLDQNQTANFISNPSIQNILGRVIGGNPSVINGLIQVTGGNSNLFLVNPAGIIFGNNASLNVPADFTATTANSIGFGANSFNSTGINNYAALIGTPSAFIFNSSQPGVIVNTGQLAVGQGQNLNLLGGTVVNTGTLAAPAGNITIAAVPGSSLLRISQPGHLLSLEIQPSQSAIANPPTLPQLLTGGNISSATGITANPDGTVQLGSTSIAVSNGDIAIATPSSHLTAGTAIISANHNLTLVETQLQTTGDLNLLAKNTVQIRDSLANSFLAKAGGNLTIQGDLGIDILALNHPQTPFQSGGDMSLISDGLISTDAHFDAGGNFEIRTLAGTTANFISLYDPIINVGGNYTVGNYTGASLKVTAGSNISYGNVTINAIDTTVHPTNPAFFLTAGGTITGTGNVSVSTVQGLLVDFLAGGDIVTRGITTQGGTITLNSTGGSIDTTGGTLNTTNGANAGANITLTANNNVNTAALSAHSQNTIGNSSNGGNITVTSNTGNIITGAINSYSQTNTGNSATGGNITLSAINGNVTTSTLTARSAVSASGSSGNSGTISITALGNINTNSISAKSETQSGGSSGNGAAITLNGNSINVIGSVESNSYSSSVGSAGSGGVINLTATNSINITSFVQSSSSALDLSVATNSSNAGAINISGGSIQIGGNLSTESNSQRGSSGNGGNITLTATNGNISTVGFVSSKSQGWVGSAGTGGNINVNSTNGAVNIGSYLKASSNLFGTSGNTNNSGNISVNATNDIIISGDLQATSYTSNGSTTNGGAINLNGSSITVTGNVESNSYANSGGSAGSGGATNLTATNGINITGYVQSSSSGATNSSNAGAINISGSSIQIGSYLSTESNSSSASSGNGANIALTATNGNISTGGFVSSRSQGSVGSAGSGGNINVNSTNGAVSIASYIQASSNLFGTTGNTSNSGNVSISTTNGIFVSGNIQANSDATTNASNGGTINLQSTNSNINITGDLETFSRGNNGTSSNAGAINIVANNGNISTNSLNTRSSSVANAGAIALTAQNITTADINAFGVVGSGNITFTADEINFTPATTIVTGNGTINFNSLTASQNINIGGTNSGLTTTLDLELSKLHKLQNTFTAINIGRADGTGTITLSPFTLTSPVTPVNIVGGSTLIGADQNTTWTITGSNTGNLSGFANPLTFNSIENLQGGNSGNIFAVNNGVTFNGTISGGSGTDTLNYSASTTAITVDLQTIIALGLENIIASSAINDTLIGYNTTNTFNITGGNSGNLNGILNFSGFENLNGGIGNDTFTFSSIGKVDGTINGAGGSDTIIANNTNNTWNITSTNAGSISNSIGNSNFTAIQNLQGGNLNDTFAFSGTGNINGTINAGAGIDTIDYSSYASAVSLNIQSIGALNVENAIGSAFSDTLTATDTNNTFNITGTNSGSLNTLTFSSFENLTGGTLNDNFVFSGTGNISGNINGSSGINSLNYSIYPNPVSINLATSTATGTGTFSNISNFIGSTNNDTITGANAANSWTLTGANIGTVGTVNFSGFENLIGGTANDTFTVINFTGTASLDGAGGADVYNINLQGTGAGNITVNDSGTFGGDTLNISGTTNTDILNLTTTQIQLSSEIINYNTGIENIAIDAGLSNDQININTAINLSGNLSLTTGSDGGNITSNATISAGSVNITGSDVTLNNAVNTNGGNINITSNNGSIVAKNTLNSSSSIRGGAIALSATGNITTANIDSHSDNGSGGNINLTTQTASVNTGNLTSNGRSAGGAISVIAIDSINLGQINTSATIGNAGNVFIDPLNDVQVEWINAQGGTIGTGGIVDITTQRYFRSTGTFSDRNGILASISTSGGAGSGDITIRHYGGYVGVPFEVGNGSINGTAGAITSSASNIIAAYQSFPGSYTQGNIQIITKDPIPTTIPVRPITPIVIPDVPKVGSPVLADNLEPSLEPHYLTPPNLSKQLTLSGEQLPLELDSRVSEIEKSFSGQFAEYLGQSTNNSLKTLAEASEILNKIEKETGVKPALIYVSFLPQAVALENGKAKTNDNDQLEILVVTGKGKPIRRVVYGTNRAQVIKVANEFRNTVSNVKKPRAYLASAQQMYKWLIQPIKADLQQQGIQNLVFIMDKGLRSMPIAALHNEQSFLIEDYSVGIMPSLSLSDTRYVDIKNAQVLAMGAATFTNQTPLPSVPVELSVVTKQLRNGKSFLNEGFTLKNLKGERQQQPFQIIHLATHGEFKAGSINNSYIQLWDTQLRLDQLRQLGWSNPPVELLVLSACRTALGDEDAELGFAGLAVLAGVKSTIGSLWYVSDQGTLGLMTEFYQQLKTAPIKSEALRRAQLAMLRGEISLEQGKLRTKANDVLLPSELANIGSINLTHPYYWAAFTVVGNPW